MLLPLVLSTILLSVYGDIYLHNPSGSNNRNRERAVNRKNANRLFDSQNNNKGGYPWAGNREFTSKPDPMEYYEGSTLQLQWTIQHGCGNNPTTHCQVVMQYACEDTLPGLRDGYPTGDLVSADGNLGYKYSSFKYNGNNEDSATPGGDGTETIPFPALSSDMTEYGQHETHEYYKACRNRLRNKGLYTADQPVGVSSISTRQNANGDRHGLECPEERDYYPYWQPNPWRDIAIYTSEKEQCSYYQTESRNVKSVFHCKVTDEQRKSAEDGKTPITAEKCAHVGGQWIEEKPWGTKAPECNEHHRLRQNFLGDITQDDGISAKVQNKKPGLLSSGAGPARFDWTVPGDVLDSTGKDSALCVLRMRYNISTFDYPSLGGMAKTGQISTQLPLDGDDSC
eukprot:g829.t1